MILGRVASLDAGKESMPALTGRLKFEFFRKTELQLIVTPGNNISEVCWPT